MAFKPVQPFSFPMFMLATCLFWRALWCEAFWCFIQAPLALKSHCGCRHTPMASCRWQGTHKEDTTTRASLCLFGRDAKISNQPVLLERATINLSAMGEPPSMGMMVCLDFWTSGVGVQSSLEAGKHVEHTSWQDLPTANPKPLKSGTKFRLEASASCAHTQWQSQMATLRRFASAKSCDAMPNDKVWTSTPHTLLALTPNAIGTRFPPQPPSMPRCFSKSDVTTLPTSLVS